MSFKFLYHYMSTQLGVVLSKYCIARKIHKIECLWAVRRWTFLVKTENCSFPPPPSLKDQAKKLESLFMAHELTFEYIPSLHFTLVLFFLFIFFFYYYSANFLFANPSPGIYGYFTLITCQLSKCTLLLYCQQLLLTAWTL